MFGRLWVIFVENILQMHFQNGDIPILLHGAPVKSKFDGLKSRKTVICMIVLFLEPLGPFFVNLNLAIYFKKLRDTTTMLRHIISENLDFGY